MVTTPPARTPTLKILMSGITHPTASGGSWVWAIAAYALNFAIIWMINTSAQSCGELGSLTRICDATQPTSQFLVLPMVTLALSFPAMFTLFAIARLGERLLCLVYFIGLTGIGIYTFILYQGGDFSLAELGCPTCNVAFLGQVIFNLLWLVALLPVGLIISHAWLRRKAGQTGPVR